MLFNSLPFIFGFLPLVLVASALFSSARTRVVFWTLASWGFYSVAGPWFLALLIGSTVVDYFVVRRLAVSDHLTERRLLLIVSIAFGLTVLGTFKYAGFAADSVTAVSAWLHHTLGWSRITVSALFDVALPAGISFYTFMTMSYTIDVYRRALEAEQDFWYFACFVALFPHLIAGPILRAGDLLPQLHRLPDRHTGRFQEGLFLFACGLAKKVLIADTIGFRVDAAYADVATGSAGTLWLAAIGYTLQLYFDFSGYSDMARGLAWLLGLEFPVNFDRPYRALDPRDFWRRWHITLSSWLRDYVYVSLGGNRSGPLLTCRNLMITMLLAGLWHGAAWNFVLWGAVHGIALCAYLRWQAAWDRLPAFLRWLAMLTLWGLSLVMFRLRTLTEVGVCYRTMFTWGGTGAPVLDVAQDPAFGVVLVLAALLAVVGRTSNEIDWSRLRPATAVALGLVLATALLKLDMSRKFLYFQF